MYLAKMNYLEVQEYLKKSDTIIIPVGSLENHGKHMPYRGFFLFFNLPLCRFI